MSKISREITAVLFCGFITLFGLLHIFLPDQEFSQTENRTLAQFPVFRWSNLADGSYTTKLEEYLSDQFPLRDGWMGLKTRYEYLLGKREFHNVYLCGDTLVSKVETADRAEQNLDFLRRLGEKTELPVYLGLIPTAAAVWRDRLPAGAESFDQRAYLERAKAVPGLIWADIAGALTEHADEPVYYRTDHHWTSLGAYYGYAALMEAMGESPAPLGKGETVSEDFYGTLYSTSGVHWLPPDSIERYVSGKDVTVEDVYKGTTGGLYVDSFLDEKDQYSSFLGGIAPLRIVHNPEAATDKKLLLVRDSYSDSLAPFLCRHFAEIHLLDLRYNKTSVAQYAADMGADGIAVLYSVDNFMKDADAVFLAQ